MLRLGLFAVGFGIGLSQGVFASPQRLIVIELRYPMDAETGPTRDATSFPDVAIDPQRDQTCPALPHDLEEMAPKGRIATWL
jgi:hypothetical protein